MLRVLRIVVSCMVAAMAVVTVSNAAAQTAVDPPAAPIPVQILTGKRVFVSNGENTAVTGVPNLTYNEFYAYMKSWGRYELVPTPAEADLVFEIRFVAVTEGTNVMGGTSVGSSIDTQLRLAILDPKTHVVLWAFIEHVEGANRQATQRKKYDQAMTTLVDNVKKLATAPPGATTDASAPDNK